MVQDRGLNYNTSIWHLYPVMKTCDIANSPFINQAWWMGQPQPLSHRRHETSPGPGHPANHGLGILDKDTTVPHRPSPQTSPKPGRAAGVVGERLTETRAHWFLSVPFLLPRRRGRLGCHKYPGSEPAMLAWTPAGPARRWRGWMVCLSIIPSARAEDRAWQRPAEDGYFWDFFSWDPHGHVAARSYLRNLYLKNDRWDHVVIWPHLSVVKRGASGVPRCGWGPWTTAVRAHPRTLFLVVALAVSPPAAPHECGNKRVSVRSWTRSRPEQSSELEKRVRIRTPIQGRRRASELKSKPFQSNPPQSKSTRRV